MKDTMDSKGELEMETGRVTIRDMLIELSNKHGTGFADKVLDPETKEVRSESLVLVNGRHYRHLVNGLDTEMNEGDTLQIFPLVAGG